MRIWRGLALLATMMAGLEAFAADPIVIQRKEITACVQSGGACLKSSRAVPYFADGKMIGYKLLEVRKGSLLEKLKLRKGDILLSANGENLSDSGRIAFWMIQIVTVKTVDLRLLRGGKSVRIDYQVKD